MSSQEKNGVLSTSSFNGTSFDTDTSDQESWSAMSQFDETDLGRALIKRDCGQPLDPDEQELVEGWDLNNPATQPSVKRG